MIENHWWLFQERTPHHPFCPTATSPGCYNANGSPVLVHALCVSSSSLTGIFLFVFFLQAKLRTPSYNRYIIASLLCHFSSSALLDPLPVSSDVGISGHNGLALETHRGVCNYTRLWLPLLWSGLFNSHYMETLLSPLFNGPLAQFSFAPQHTAAQALSLTGADRSQGSTHRQATHIQSTAFFK